MDVDGFLDELRHCLGDEHVLVDPDLRRGYEIDWTRRFTGTALAVVRPADVTQVRTIIGLCAQHGVSVVPQGGNTGLVGGSVPLRGGLVLSTERFTKRGIVNVADRTLTVGAGVKLSAVQRLCTANGMRFAVDLAARESASIGGMFATNAGGINHFRFGGMRENVRSCTAVLGDATLAGPEKLELLCGSEGTLGVVTEVTLALIPETPKRTVMIASFPDVEAAVAAADQWRNAKETESIELFLDSGLALVCETFSLPRPMEPAPAYLLVDMAGDSDTVAKLLHDMPNVVDTAIGESDHDRNALWRYREDHTLAINTLGPPMKFDVRVPMERCPSFLPAVTARVSEVDPNAVTISFGHICDGNLHINVTRTNDPTIETAVYECVEQHGGSIVAEHGVGSVKAARYLAGLDSRAKAKFADAKKYCDPIGIMNPGVAFSVN